MTVLAEIWLAFLGIGFVLSLMGGIRSSWVQSVRMDLLNGDMLSYDSLPSYNTMMLRFWIWDASKFIGQGARDAARAQLKQEASVRRGKVIAQRARMMGEKL